MTYYGSKELAAAFRTVRNNTIKIAEEIPETHYGYRATPDVRTVGETLVHMAVATRAPLQLQMVERRSTLVGVDFFSLMGKLAAEEQTPRSKNQILELLRSEGENFAQALEGLSEEFLAEQVQYPEGMVPPRRTRFDMLLGSKEHEMHHRGQLMLIERMLGITPHLTRQIQERVAAMRAAQTAG